MFSKETYGMESLFTHIKETGTVSLATNTNLGTTIHPQERLCITDKTSQSFGTESYSGKVLGQPFLPQAICAPASLNHMNAAALAVRALSRALLDVASRKASERRDPAPRVLLTRLISFKLYYEISALQC